jgi:hypothetical protein
LKHSHLEPSLEPFRKANRFGLALLASQITMALIVLPLAGPSDFFPYFTWSLFNGSRKVSSEVLIYISEIDGKKFSPAISHQKYFTEISTKPMAVDPLIVHEALRSFTEAPNEEKQSVARKIIESALFKGKGEVEYKILWVKLDRLKYFTDFSILKIEADLGTFKVEGE